MSQARPAAQPLVRLRACAAAAKRDILALYLAARDPRVPLTAKLLAGAVAAYALSPIDLIPDFIPVLGYLDDLILVPLGIALALRMIPPPLIAELRATAQARLSSRPPRSLTAAAVIVLLWLAAGAAAVAYWL